MSKTKRTAKTSALDLDYIVEELRPFAVPIDSLELDPENARAHGDENRATVAASLRERGQTLPITVRKANRRIMTGNCTAEEMRALGHTHVAALFLDYTEEQAIAWAIVHNRSAELAVWDYQQLAATISEHPDVDWEAAGFDADELEGILAAVATEQPDTTTVSEHEREIGDEAEDEIPETPAEPITKVSEVVELGPHVLHCCDCMDLLRSLPDNSIDAIVTDPPYGLSPDGRARTWDDIETMRREGKGPKAGFMGSAWDAGVPGISWARECLRVLKPGGYLVAFSATRTIHRLTTAAEDAGFEIIDQLGWLQWEGMPHGMNVSLAIDKAAGVEREVIGSRPVLAGSGFGDVGHGLQVEPDAVKITVPATDLAKLWDDYHTRLKPCAEPICLAQRPLDGTVVENIERWGTGAMNIGATRHGEDDPAWPGPSTPLVARDVRPSESRGVALGGSVDGSLRKAWRYDPPGRFTGNVFQSPKPSRRERNEGTDGLPEQAKAQSVGALHANDDLSRRFLSAPMANIHPTVKPVAAMRRLLRLVLPPVGGTVLEPFGGSGTTLVAASSLVGCKVIASEREPKYCDIIRARVTHAISGQ